MEGRARSITDLTSPDAVRRALDEFDELGRDAFLAKYGFGRARRYFVRHEGRLYDSKAIAGAAFGFEHPEAGALAHTEFAGGEHGAKAKLEDLGFDVVARPALAAADILPLRDALEAALKAQHERPQGGWSDDLQKAIAVTLPNAIRGVVGQDFRVKGSAGAGNQAEIPWVSVMPPGLKGASEGRYIVYLFSADGERVFLALSQAVTGQPKHRLSELADDLRAVVGEQRELLEHIDLRPQGDLGEKYALATAYALEYRRNAVPSGDDLERDLRRFLDLLDLVAEEEPRRSESWIFQANPTVYEIDRAVRALPRIEWTVRQHRDRVRAGDRAYIWRSGADAGIIAIGTIETDPADVEPNRDEDVYYLQRDEFSAPEPRVNIRIDRVLDDPLHRSTLQGDPVLRDLRIIRVPRATVYEVTPTEEIRLNQLVDGRDAPPRSHDVTFSLASIKLAATQEPRRLRLSEQVYASVFAALESGKHVVLTGAPGTAKTTLAEAVAEAAARAGLCSGHVLTTATADWTTYETIGGLRPTKDNQLEFGLGHFLDAIEKNKWLVIDELNRSNFDRAFGQLFTVLSGQAVQLPYSRRDDGLPLALVPDGATVPPAADALEIPASWRVIATMNVFDKSLLFEMSFALMRRFAFIEVASPEDDVFEDLIASASRGHAAAAALAVRFLPLRKRKDLGPAVFMDMARYLATRFEVDGATEHQLAFEAFYSYLLPQFEGVDELEGERLYKHVRKLVGHENEERLRTTLQSVLGLELLNTSPAGSSDDEEEVDLTDPSVGAVDERPSS